MTMRIQTSLLIGLAVCVVAGTATVSLAGKPGEGIQLRRLMLRPYAQMSITYDTNPALRRDDYEEEDDIYLSESLGVSLSLPTKIINVHGSVYVSRRDYLQQDANDDGVPGREVDGHTDFGHNLSFSAGERFGRNLTVDFNYQHVTDDTHRPESQHLLNQPTQAEPYPLEERASRVERGQWTASVGYHDDLTDKIDGSVGWNLNGTVYDSGDLFDHFENAFHGNVGYLVTDKSAMFLSGQYGLHDSDAFDGTSDAKTVHVGWRTRFTAKTSFNAGVGVEQFSPAGLPDREFFSFSLGWGWRPTRKWNVSVNGGNSGEPSSYERNNWRRMTTVSAGAGYTLTQKMSCSVGLAYQHDKYEYAYEYIDKPGVPGRDGTDYKPFDPDNYIAVPDTNDEAAENHDVTGRVGLSYRLNKCFSFSLGASHEIYSSNFASEDFGQTRVSLSGRGVY